MESIFIEWELALAKHPTGSLRKGLVLLRLHRISCCDPICEATENGSHTGIAIMQKKIRRTGAGVLVQSGAVGDDPLFFREIQTRWIPLDLDQGNIDGACDMTRLIGVRVANIDNDRCSGIEGRSCFFNGYARHIPLGERKLTGWLRV